MLVPSDAEQSANGADLNFAASLLPCRGRTQTRGDESARARLAAELASCEPRGLQPRKLRGCKRAVNNANEDYSPGDGEGEGEVLASVPLLPLPLVLFFLVEVVPEPVSEPPVAPPVSVVRPFLIAGRSVEPEGPVPRPAPPPAEPPASPRRICSVGVPPLLCVPVLLQETKKASVAAQTMGVRINFFIAW